jgi:hypothetical protein
MGRGFTGPIWTRTSASRIFWQAGLRAKVRNPFNDGLKPAPAGPRTRRKSTKWVAFLGGVLLVPNFMNSKFKVSKSEGFRDCATVFESLVLQEEYSVLQRLENSGFLIPMKRDMDVIRAVLMTAEDENHERLESLGLDIVCFHVQLCMDAQFVEGNVSSDFNGRTMTWERYAVMRLTWLGAEALDAMRDETIWKKAQQHVIKPAASWTFSLLFDWLKAEARQRIFPQPPP